MNYIKSFLILPQLENLMKQLVVVIIRQTTICEDIVIFTGKSIYKRETVGNKNMGLVIE